MRTLKLFSSFILVGLAACGEPQVDDASLYLTGTEEGAITLANGQKACLGKKELICHIPPGNPANAHTICVSKHAVEPHQSHHGDLIGACVTEPNPPPDEPPPPDDDGDPQDPTEPTDPTEPPPPPPDEPPPPPTDGDGPIL